RPPPPPPPPPPPTAGQNFSSSTVWTGNVETNNGFYINERCVGRLYIADTVDLSIIADDAYDFILSCNNIEHIANPMKAVKQWILKLRHNGIIIIVAPRKASNFDHYRKPIRFAHLLNDYKKDTDEHDNTHLEEILKLHDLTMDSYAGTFEQFKERSLKNYENRCLHHHVFDMRVLKQICSYFNLEILFTEEKYCDYIIVAKNIT
ncbi:MAG: class I SAM-dependent methyltransferase, partial [Spirochaetaceae bacterium]|nr:class I SAM-dependent methyltransferase [Spirochaetaceae bacterium]